MNTYKTVTILFLTLILSCQKEVVDTSLASQEVEMTSQKSMFDAIYEIDFKEDFVVPSKEEGGTKATRPTDDEWRLIKAASSRNTQELQESFDVSKEKIFELYLQNTDEKYTATIQNASLKYLRRLILLNDTPENRANCLDILRVLVDTKATDLDVIVDSYLFSKSLMSMEEESNIYAYISEVYSNDIALIRERAPELKEAYEQAVGDEKKKYLLWGKGIERRSQACAYARSLIPSLTNI